LSAVCAQVIRAQTPPVAAVPGVGSPAVLTLTTTFVSQDLFRGYFLGGPSLEPDIDVSNGIYDLGLWSNSTVRNRTQGPSSTEVEAYGSYQVDIVKDKLSAEAGFTLYALPWGPGFGGVYRSSIEPSIGLNFPIGKVQFSPRVYDDIVLRVRTLEANAACALPLKASRTELDLTVTLGTEQLPLAWSGPSKDTRVWATYWLFQVAAPFPVGRQGTFTVGWCYTGSTFNERGPFGLGEGSRSARGLVTASFALKL